MNYSNCGMIMNNNEINSTLKELLEPCMKCWPPRLASILAVVALFALSNSIRGTVYAAQGSLPNDLLYPEKTSQKISRLDWKLTRKTVYLYNALRLSVLGKQPIRSIPLQVNHGV